MSKKYIQKILSFGACSNDTEPDRLTKPAASMLELEKPTPKRKVDNENTKPKRQKWNDVYIICFFFYPKVKKPVLSHLFNVCFVVLDIAASCLGPSKLRYV